MKPSVVEKNHRLLQEELKDLEDIISAFNPIHTEEGWACDVYFFNETGGDYSIRKHRLLRAYLGEDQDWTIDQDHLKGLLERIENEAQKYME